MTLTITIEELGGFCDTLNKWYAARHVAGVNALLRQTYVSMDIPNRLAGEIRRAQDEFDALNPKPTWISHFRK